MPKLTYESQVAEEKLKPYQSDSEPIFFQQPTLNSVAILISESPAGGPQAPELQTIPSKSDFFPKLDVIFLTTPYAHSVFFQ